ncbi:hypothetical protein [Listeria aquatica]|uniref:Uncharacterized protein n=1 Tax=Listeria aquatica FSL S10-1188 TaxID=1265818 RepID=W7AMX5_9LIST|nr:hypothetical protein [Listeria aquatica]EUJ16599.1 hypothetical protein MAQA_15721 [Listeria aquatica FSL S10-1188]
MVKLGKKSLISYLQPVNIEDDQPFEQLQKMRLQDAILYAESIRRSLPLGEFVSLTWRLDTKKGKSYTFSFHIGNLESDQTALMTLVEEGVKESLPDQQQIEEVLAILPLHYEAKEKEFEAPQQWVLENQTSFYYPGTENSSYALDDLADHGLEEPVGLYETFPEEQDRMQTSEQPYALSREDEIQEQPQALEEVSGEHQEKDWESSNQEKQEETMDDQEEWTIPEIAVLDTDRTKEKAKWDQIVGIYQRYPNIDDQVKGLFIRSQKAENQENIFERQQMKAEQKEINKSIQHIKKELGQQEMAYSQVFEQEKVRLEQEKQASLKKSGRRTATSP